MCIFDDRKMEDTLAAKSNLFIQSLIEDVNESLRLYDVYCRDYQSQCVGVIMSRIMRSLADISCTGLAVLMSQVATVLHLPQCSATITRTYVMFSLVIVHGCV